MIDYAYSAQAVVINMHRPILKLLIIISVMAIASMVQAGELWARPWIQFCQSGKSL